jgi:hypothetical protein
MLRPHTLQAAGEIATGGCGRMRAWLDVAVARNPAGGADDVLKLLPVHDGSGI